MRRLILGLLVWIGVMTLAMFMYYNTPRGFLGKKNYS